jgi:hypothetical protein
LEISWIAAETGMKHQSVPKELLAEAEAFAKVDFESYPNFNE